MWFQELRPLIETPDIVQREDVEHLGYGIYIGAKKITDPLRNSYTIGMWWHKGAYPKSYKYVLNKLTGLDRPGSSSRCIVWTTDPRYQVLEEDPLLVDEISTEDLFYYIHLLKAIHVLEPTNKEFNILKFNFRNIISQEISPAIRLSVLERESLYPLMQISDRKP